MYFPGMAPSPGRMVASGGHADLRVLKREMNEKTGKMRSEIAVEHAREAIHFLQLTPAMGGWRIVIIDPVDDLSTAASNSLLKAIVYCTAVTLIHCYYGYFASGGPVGVGEASGRAIRASLVMIMVLDLATTIIFWGLKPEFVFKG